MAQIYSYEQRQLENMVGEFITDQGTIYKVVRNTSGGNITSGDIVVVDTAGGNPHDVTTTTQSANLKVAGAVAGGWGTVADDEYFPMCVEGLNDTNVKGRSGGSVAGDYVQTTTVAGKGTTNSVAQNAGGQLGILLEAVASGTTSSVEVLIRLR